MLENLLPCSLSWRGSLNWLFFSTKVVFPLVSHLDMIMCLQVLLTIPPFCLLWKIDGIYPQVITLPFMVFQYPSSSVVSILNKSIAVGGNYSHEIKRCFLLGRKAMKNLDSILKSRGITLLTKVHIVKAMVSPAVMYECESWPISKAECWRIDAFQLWY